MLERRVTPVLEDIMEKRKTVVFDDENHQALEGVSRKMCVAAPIIISGDVSGAVVMVESDTMTKSSESDEKLVRVAAAFLGKQMEE